MIGSITNWKSKHFFLRQDRSVLDQKYKLLDAKFEKIRYEQQLETDSVIVSKLCALLRQKQSWTGVSQIEQYLISLYTGEQIVMELKIKMLAAQRKLYPNEAAFFEKEFAAATSSVQQKILLNNLNEKLQMADDVEDLENTYVALIRVRTSFLFFFAIIIFFAVDQLPATAHLLGIERGNKANAIVTAMSMGWIGTCFSMLTGLKNKLTESSLQELKVIHRIDYIFSRTIIGLISGLIVFYFFESKLVSGAMFPVINATTPVTDNVSYALIIVWCFLSGFSEKLVPDLLAKSEKKMQDMPMGGTVAAAPDA